MAEVQVRSHPPRTVPAAERYLNQELSRIEYAARLLARAEDSTLPLLERVRFLAFSAEFLDDFFQIRVAGLSEQLLSQPDLLSPDGLTPMGQLRAIRERVLPLTARQSRVFTKDLSPRLAEAGMRIVSAADLSRSDAAHLGELFRAQIFPVLTPLAVDPAHPFPYISHRSLSLAVMVQDPLRKQRRFARIKVPPLLPRFVALPGGSRFVPLEQVIASHLQVLFPGMEILGHHTFRVTRDADLEVGDGEGDDLLAAIQIELRRQSRTARAVRLEVETAMSAEVLELLVRELELEDQDVYKVDGLLDLESVAFFADADRPDLKTERWTPITPPRLLPVVSGSTSVFEVLKKGDLLVHHPYDSFANSVEAFISQAAADPQVLAIKQTLYRTSAASPIARSLIDAAEAGKQVVALVELKARGDEQANIAWAQALEKSGVHVVYGLVGLKTHAKVSLVVRQEAAGIRHYVHVGTGNYNPSTAQAYEDLGLFSADPDLGADAVELFNSLTGYSRQRKYRRLLVAPSTLRGSILKLIHREASRSGGRIIMKVNNLIDPTVIEALYKAAGAGAEIDLIVRSASALRPRAKKLSKNIRVRSLVGHFLEHSRIFRFGRDPVHADYYIGSADMMERNLDRRVEALAPIRAPELRVLVEEILQVGLADDVLAWELRSDGRWFKVPHARGVDAQRRFRELAQQRARG